jgi:hypothetical protein
MTGLLSWLPFRPIRRADTASISPNTEALVVAALAKQPAKSP